MRCVPTVFTKNRERLITHDALIALFNAELAIAQRKKSVSGEHFSVDSRLIQAWAGHKAFAPKTSRLMAVMRPKTQTTSTSMTTRTRVLAISKASAAARTHTSPAPIPMRGCTAMATRPASFASWGTRSATSATD